MAVGRARAKAIKATCFISCLPREIGPAVGERSEVQHMCPRTAQAQPGGVHGGLCASSHQGGWWDVGEEGDGKETGAN